MKTLALSIALASSFGCSPAPQSPPQAGGSATADIASLSDEFTSTSTLGSWKHVHQTEGWNADQLAKCAVEGGWLTLVPHTSTWYMDYRGVLVYKDVPGDFVVTTSLTTTGRDGRSAPRAPYSLGGIMVRSPRSDQASNWREGGENYVFLSLGSADQSGRYQFEVKTTQNSQSNLEKILAPSGEAQLRVAKIGQHLILLRNQGNGWIVHKRYSRPDMPATLQVGLTVYTDYNSASQLGARQHNGTVIRGGNPDLIARFDYVRFWRPKVPAGVDLRRASDGQLLQFLGD